MHGQIARVADLKVANELVELMLQRCLSAKEVKNSDKFKRLKEMADAEPEFILPKLF